MPRVQVVYASRHCGDAPKSLQERLVRLMPAARRVLPAGDFRDWVAIEAWAHEIAAQVVATAQVG